MNDRVKACREGGMATLRPRNGNAAQKMADPPSRRSSGVLIPMAMTWRHCAAESPNWNWGIH